MLGINLKHIIITAVGVGTIVVCTLLMTFVTLWGAAGALGDFLPAG